MSEPARRHKAVNFDLDTEALRERFGEQGRPGAYSAVRRYLEAHDFEHRQGSGYRSLVTLSDLDVADLIVAMYKELPWLLECVQKLDVTNIGTQYDLHSIACDQFAEEEPPVFDVEL